MEGERLCDELAGALRAAGVGQDGHEQRGAAGALVPGGYESLGDRLLSQRGGAAGVTAADGDRGSGQLDVAGEEAVADRVDRPQLGLRLDEAPGARVHPGG